MEKLFFVFIPVAFALFLFSGCGGLSYNREKGVIVLGDHPRPGQAVEATAGVEVKARAGISYQQGPGFTREQVQGGEFFRTIGGTGDLARNVLGGTGETQSGLAYDEKRRLIYKTTTRK